MSYFKRTGLAFLMSLGVLSAVHAQGTEVRTIKNLPADPEPQSDQFTLFSLAKGEVVPLKDFESDKWDLGFKGTSIIVNGGAERKGKGGVFIGEGAFDQIEKLPSGITWAVDEPGGKTAIPGGSGNGWYQYIFINHEIKPIPNKVLYIKTADEKFAKLEILSYYKNVEGEVDTPGRYYTFRYVLLPD